MPTDRTISEDLFEQFCQRNDIAFSRIPETSTQTPDYELDARGYRIVAEIKEVTDNEADREQIALLETRGSTTYWPAADDRLRRKIHEGNRQFKEFVTDNVPTLLVIHDRTFVGSSNSLDMKDAMYGTETGSVELVEDEPVITNSRLDRNGMCRSDRHTSTSAVAKLWRDASGELRLAIYHNKFARVRLDPTRLYKPTITHLTLGPANNQDFPEWVPI